MKKRFYLIILILSLFIVTGCGKEGNKNINYNTGNPVDENLFKIKEKEFHLDTEKEFESLKYKVSSDFREINNFTPASKYMQYNYQPEDEANYFFFRIFFYKNKDFAFVRKDLGIDDKFKFIDGKTDNIEYKLIDEERTDGTIHLYFISKDNSTYVIHFVSQNDIKDFETKTLNSLKF